MTDAVASFIDEQQLGSVDTVGSSVGARMVLELGRRGAGATRWRWIPEGSGPMASCEDWPKRRQLTHCWMR